MGGLSVFLFMFIQIPDRAEKKTKSMTIAETFKTLDVIGFLIFSPAMIMFLLALEWGGTTYPWGSAKVIGLFCGSGGTLILFLAWEYRRGETAMIPLSMVRQRIVYSSVLNMFALSGAMLVVSYYLAIYFQAVKGVSPMLSGVYLLPSILSQMVLAVVSGILGMSTSRTFLLTPVLISSFQWVSWVIICRGVSPAESSSRLVQVC